MGDDPLTVKWWCSWCSKLCIHTLTEENVFARSIYTCGHCHRRTLPCSTCDEAGAEGGDLWDNWFCAVCGGDRDYWPMTRSQPRPGGLPYGQPPVFYGQQANGQQVFYVPVSQLPQGYYVPPHTGYGPVMQHPGMQQPVMQQPPQQQPVPARAPAPVQLSEEEEALQRALFLSLEEAQEPSKATSRDAILRLEVERQIEEWKVHMYADNPHLESIPRIREMEERGRITARLIAEGYGKPSSAGVEVPPPAKSASARRPGGKARQTQEEADMEKAIAESLALSSKKMFDNGEGRAATNSMSALFGDEEEEDDGHGSGGRQAEVAQAASAGEASSSRSAMEPHPRSTAAQGVSLVVPEPAPSAASTSSLPVAGTSSSSSSSSSFSSSAAATLPAVTVATAVPAVVEAVATKEPNTKVANEADARPKTTGTTGAVSSSAGTSPAQSSIAVDPIASRLMATQLSGADDESDDGSFEDDDDDDDSCVHDAKARNAVSPPAVVPVASSLTAEVVNDGPAIQLSDEAAAAAEAEVATPASAPSPGASKASSKATVILEASGPAAAATVSVEGLAAETPKSGTKSGAVTGVQAAQCTRQQQSLAQQAAQQVQKRNSVSSAATTPSVAAETSPAPAERRASTTENNPFATLKSRDQRETAEAARLLASMGGASPSPTRPNPASSAPSPAQEKVPAPVQSSPKAAAKPAPSPEPATAAAAKSVTPAAARDPKAASSAASVPVSSPRSFQKVSAAATPEVTAPQQAERRASTTENNPFATLKSRDQRETAEAARLLASMGGASPSPTRPNPASSAPSPAQEKVPAPVQSSPKAAAKPAPSPEPATAAAAKSVTPAAAGQKGVVSAVAPVTAAPSPTPSAQAKVPAVREKPAAAKSANKKASAAAPKGAEDDANAELSAAARRYMQMTAGRNSNGASSDEDDE
ncbi:hypothetical protein CYMTET_40858 [Cymbomonas tetramitiformis]|uniref:Uncharacterized protein n=1 Tax=Cymbomonas tetramitiformis TaxID=36881 RepID=A0AAE0F476_9CHLO|nr:hypothetical protein CYMTET_40858 [Cymbomonas tetramitiformis]